MRFRPLLAVAVLLAFLGASASPSPSPTPGAPTLFVDGVRVLVQPPPLIVHGRVYVPLQRTLDALGIPFRLRNGVLHARFGAHRVTLRLGESSAMLDGSAVDFGAPPLVRDFTTYVPLRFVGAVLGAQAHYDAQARRIAIVGSSVGETGSGFVLSASGHGVREGSVSALDVLSTPMTVTLLFGGSAHTIALHENVRVELHDVATNVVRPGTLADVLPGDFVRVDLGKKGRGTEIHDDFGVRAGRIAAVAGGEFVLADGHVIVPDRTTQWLLDGAPATFAQVRPGDDATIRYNVESDEILQVILSDRHDPLAPSGAISSIVIDPTTPLRAGELLRVTMRGTPGGIASFDIGGLVHDVGMREERPGYYGGSLHIGDAVSIARSPVIVTLLVGSQRSVARGATLVSASSVPPGIGRVGPGPGSTVSSTTPAIYATFLPDAVGVDPRSATLIVDGHDVTSETIRSARFIHFIPEIAYSGVVHVTVRVADFAGNIATRSWSFTVRP